LGEEFNPWVRGNEEFISIDLSKELNWFVDWWDKSSIRTIVDKIKFRFRVPSFIESLLILRLGQFIERSLGSLNNPE